LETPENSAPLGAPNFNSAYLFSPGTPNLWELRTPGSPELQFGMSLFPENAELLFGLFSLRTSNSPIRDSVVHPVQHPRTYTVKNEVS